MRENIFMNFQKDLYKLWCTSNIFQGKLVCEMNISFVVYLLSVCFVRHMMLLFLLKMLTVSIQQAKIFVFWLVDAILIDIFYQEFQNSSWRFLSFLIYNTIFGKINVKLVPSAYLMHIVFQIRSIFWYFFCFVFFLQAGDWKITLIYYNTITSSPNFRGNPRCLQNHNCFMCSYVLLTQIAVIKTYERTSRTPLLQTPPGK